MCFSDYIACKALNSVKKGFTVAIKLIGSRTVLSNTTVHPVENINC